MIELRGDLFNHNTYTHNGSAFNKKPDALCISTNGFVKSNGRCVMGRGCALKATQIVKDIDLVLGTHIRRNGNVVGLLGVHNGIKMLSFPVKVNQVIVASDKSNIVKHMRDRFNAGGVVPGWAAKADVELIKQSAVQLKSMADDFKWGMVILPRVGAGAGELEWSDVKTALDEILDDRFGAITF